MAQREPPMPSPRADDYYALLGVDATVDAQGLRRAWRRLAAQWHPDRAGEAATLKFQQLAAAYEVLSQPLARAAYDRRRRAVDGAAAAVGATPSAQAARPPAAAAAAAVAPPPSPQPARPPAAAAAAAAAAAVAPRPAAPATMLARLCGNLATLIPSGAARLEDDGDITLVLREDEAAQGGMVT